MDRQRKEGEPAWWWKKRGDWKGKRLLRMVKRSDGGRANDGPDSPNSLSPKSCKNSCQGLKEREDWKGKL